MEKYYLHNEIETIQIASIERTSLSSIYKFKIFLSFYSFKYTMK